jgi:hypothetical protein
MIYFIMFMEKIINENPPKTITACRFGYRRFDYRLTILKLFVSESTQYLVAGSTSILVIKDIKVIRTCKLRKQMCSG